MGYTVVMPNPSLGPYAGPVLVSVAYVLVYYICILNVLRTKMRLRIKCKQRNKTFDRYQGGDKEMLAADRIMLNTLEHMPPFLVLFWLHAVFVDPFASSIAGSIYVITRILYPVVYGKRAGRGAPPRIMYVTFIGYAVLCYFAGSLIIATL